MRKIQLIVILAIISLKSYCQELYVYTEPASNMPAHSISARLTSTLGNDAHDKFVHRYTPEIMFGFSKKLMAHAGITFANMHTSKMQFESVYVYGKYRFLSIDDVHKHFRMAIFAEATHSQNSYDYDEVSIIGDRSGIQFGLIATQLINKLAVSGTFSHTQAMDPSRYDKFIYTPERLYKSLNYSVSAGYLVLPREYKSYNQLNVNIYTELLGQRTLDRKTYYLDFAPSLQFIFNSNSKLNLGYRFQIKGDQHRMEKSFLVGFEHTFFNALK
ncbi:MAG: hypothetical protein ACXWCZ_06140 [Flavisolibacter sp.]